MQLSELKDQLITLISIKDSSIAKEQSELEASVTHWLQNPAVPAPLMTRKQFGICRQLTSANGRPARFANWMVAEESEPYQPSLALGWKGIPYRPPRRWDFTFIDLFAGIGGFRIAWQAAGGKCVFSSEWDRYAKRTYEANFGEVPYGDIRRIPKKSIPDHDVLCAGFPCQPFSLAGVSKKNSLGRQHGFRDETQGTLFFELKEIIRVKRPKAFMLENVKNLLAHDHGRTFEVIRRALQDELKYTIAWKIVDGAAWVPQHRERVFIVGYDSNRFNLSPEEIIIPVRPPAAHRYIPLNRIIQKEVTGCTLGPGTWATLVRHKAFHEAHGNGFGYGLHRLPIRNDAITRTISARYHKDGAEVLIEQPGHLPRRLTVKEAMQLQGYDPEKFKFPVSNTQIYRQIGNSVVIPAVQACAVQIAKVLKAK